MTRKHAIAALAFSFVFAGAMSGADAFTGSWELNIGKSKPEPGFTHKRVTLTIEQTGPETSRWFFDQVTMDGKKRPVEVLYTFDGKEHEVQINGSSSSVTAKILDASTRSVLSKRNGQIVHESVWKLSPDGKALTVTATHRPEGKPAYETVFVYEK
jgi:hypothetical protein